MTRLIRFRSVFDPTGCLTPAEVPFEVRNVFWLHDVPGGARRGGHAHRSLEEVIVALSGSFEVVTRDEHGVSRWPLNRADVGLYVGHEWRHLGNFSGNAVALVLASQPYDPADYIRDEAEYLSSLPPVGPDHLKERAAAYAKGFDAGVAFDQEEAMRLTRR
jgi:hypothetical protein